MASKTQFNTIIDQAFIYSHLSPFVFTNTLLPLLRKTALIEGSDVRIVNLASDAHTYVSDVQFKTKDDFNLKFHKLLFPSVKRYGFTKLLNMLWTLELSRRLSESTDEADTKIICLCVHPGAVLTEGNIEGAARLPWPFSVILKFVLYSLAYKPAEGGYTVSIAAAATKVRAEVDKYKAAYLVPIGKLGNKSKTAQNEILAMDLWKLSESVLGEIGL